ncbi:hypothetical protein LTR17_018370 [Elasticomyces elasticus]|nr:hypothetical protein LTR17_018370 [Elasticomyces elasticus]
MADIAGTTGTFLNLAITWYKLLVTRKTADATLKNHIRNFAQCQVNVNTATKGIFDPRKERHFLVRSQAIWVLHLDERLREWLFDAGFKPTVQEAGVYLVRVRAKPSSSVCTVQKRPDQPGPFKFPRFGITKKETHFDSLFQKLKDGFERLETMMCDDCYCDPGKMQPTPDGNPRPNGGPTLEGRAPRRRGGLRGGYDSDEDRDVNDFEEYDYASRQRQEVESAETSDQPTRALQDLSQRFERGIGDMLIKSGRIEEYRRRRRARVGFERFHAEVLNEEIALEAFHEEQRLDRERDQERRRLEILRMQRRAREARHHPEDESSESSDTTQEHRGPGGPPTGDPAPGRPPPGDPPRKRPPPGGFPSPVLMRKRPPNKPASVESAKTLRVPPLRMRPPNGPLPHKAEVITEEQLEETRPGNPHAGNPDIVYPPADIHDAEVLASPLPPRPYPRERDGSGPDPVHHPVGVSTRTPLLLEIFPYISRRRIPSDGSTD